MKINLSYPATGCQKLIEIADELKVGNLPSSSSLLSLSSSPSPPLLSPLQPSTSQVRPFYDKRMGQEVEADTLGDEFKVKTQFNWS